MAGRIASTTVCESGTCNAANLLVRGDKISFVSVEQVEKVGEHPLDEKKMPSDLWLPGRHVLVHDTVGSALTQCDFYVVKWYPPATRTRHRSNPQPSEQELEAARLYFGSDGRFTRGTVDIPNGPWHLLAQVRFIRYQRVGMHGGSYEHKYEVPVELHYCKRPLAWRLPLPTGCVVDARGFVWP